MIAVSLKFGMQLMVVYIEEGFYARPAGERRVAICMVKQAGLGQSQKPLHDTICMLKHAGLSQSEEPLHHAICMLKQAGLSHS